MWQRAHWGQLEELWRQEGMLLMVGRHSRGIVRKEDVSIQVYKQFLLPLREARELVAEEEKKRAS